MACEFPIKLCILQVALFFFFTQCGIFSVIFLYAGANPAYSNSTAQKTECILLFLGKHTFTYIQKQWKISMTMINDLQFLEKMYETDFFLAPPTKSKIR